MALILLEALLALALLLGIVWWTMFAGRRNGELPPADDAAGTAGAHGVPAPEPASSAAPSNRYGVAASSSVASTIRTR